MGLAWQSSGEDSMLSMQGGAGFIPGPATKIPKILLRFLVVWPEDFQKIRKKGIGEKKKKNWKYSHLSLLSSQSLTKPLQLDFLPFHAA